MQVGKTAEGFINLGFDAEAIHDKSGVNVVFCSLEEIFRDMNAVSDADATALAGTIACGARCCTASPQELDASARLILAERTLSSLCFCDFLLARISR